MLNYLSIDLESWAYPNLSEYKNLTSQERKRIDNGNVRNSTKIILKTLARYRKKITFFVVAQLYEWYPDVIEEIARQGHEIAFHTYTHDILTNSKILEESLLQSDVFIKTFKPIGFRAPRVSIKKEYYKLLKKYMFKYDSSTYNSFNARKTTNGIIEFPVSTWSKFPIGSGYSIGLFGRHIGQFYRHLNRNNIPFIAFLHNWQILSPIKPSFPTPGYLIKHPYYFPYMRNTGEDFKYLLDEFDVAPMRNLL